MKKIFIILMVLCFVPMANSDADRQGHMPGHMMDSPGYGMVKQSEPGHETCSMMGCTGCKMMYPGMMMPGMMGYGPCGMYGTGYGVMSPGLMGYGGCGMMIPGMMGRHQMMHGMGPGMMRGYSDEEYKKFLDDTRDLRKELHTLKFEYFETARRPDPDPEKLAEIEKKIWDTQKKIYEKSGN